MDKPQIIVSPQATQALARVRQAQGDARPKGRNVSEMLSQLYVIAGDMLDELATAELPLDKRLMLAEKAARLLPVLDKAERKSRKGAGDKAPEDMTDSELLKALKSSGVFRLPKSSKA